MPAGSPEAVQPLAGVTAFTMKRRITRRMQLHEFRPVGPDGVEGDVVLHETMKQLSMTEEYRFSADAEHARRCWTVRARGPVQVLDLLYDVYDEHGAPIGMFHRPWLASQVLVTWRLMAPGIDLTGLQADVVGLARTAVARRAPVLSMIPIRLGFDVRFRDAAERTYLRVEGRGDRYLVTMPGGWVDPRLAAGMAAVLDWRGFL